MLGAFEPRYLDQKAVKDDVLKPTLDKLAAHLQEVQGRGTTSPVQHLLNAMEMSERQRSEYDSRDASKEHRRAKLVALDDKKLVIDPEHLDPILSAQSKVNNELQAQNLSLRNDVTVLSDCMNLLLQDNTKLRGFLEKKNQDLRSLLETMSENEGETILNLRRQLGLLNDENKALTFEISALKELRLKDLGRLEAVENKLHEERLISRKIREDLSESNLVNEGLQSQHKLLDNRLKALNLELEEESKRREAAEKRAGLSSSAATNANTMGSFQSLNAQLTEKMKSVKVQEKLQQENLLVLNEKNEINERLLALNEEIRKKDSLIQLQITKTKQAEEASDRLKSELNGLSEANQLLKKKVQALLENSSLISGESLKITSPNTGDPHVLLSVLERENKILRDKLKNLEDHHKLAGEQMNKMHQDMLTVLQQEVASLKDEKRNLLNRVKVLMNRNQEQQRRPDAPLTASQHARRRSGPKYVTDYTGSVEQRQGHKSGAWFSGLQFGVDLRSREPYFRDIDDCVSEPTPNRLSNLQRRREASEIEDTVERINSKHNSRSNSPAAVARYIVSGEGPSGGWHIERSRPNSMLVKGEVSGVAEENRGTATWGDSRGGVWAGMDKGPQWMAVPPVVVEPEAARRPVPPVTVSSDLGRTEVMSSVAPNLLEMFRRDQFQLPPNHTN